MNFKYDCFIAFELTRSVCFQGYCRASYRKRASPNQCQLLSIPSIER